MSVLTQGCVKPRKEVYEMYGSSKMMVLVSKRNNVYMRRHTDVFSMTCSLNGKVFKHTSE